jgi:hypothetical protein
MSQTQNRPYNTSAPFSNEQVAQSLEEVAALLEAQRANPFRVRAYNQAARRVRGLPRPVHEILEAEGLEGLDRLPGIGLSLARTIERLTYNGRLGLLERLRGEAGPEQVLASVPGIGPELAGRIHQQLGIDTLEELEMAAHDGRLAGVAGFGKRRLLGVKDALAGRFRRRPFIAPAQPALQTEGRPTVEELLKIDRDYREAADAGRLPRIAPRRFNPTGEAWLPILHTTVASRHYTALFSNTAQAHQLNAQRNWVVIYRDDRDGDGQWTVVTPRTGPLRGRRVVRGREAECSAYYAREKQEELPLWRK